MRFLTKVCIVVTIFMFGCGNNENITNPTKQVETKEVYYKKWSKNIPECGTLFDWNISYYESNKYNAYYTIGGTKWECDGLDCTEPLNHIEYITECR